MESVSPTARPLAVVVCGPSGVGKSTIGKLLAHAYRVPFVEGDEFHSAANIAKMSAGLPLTDEDRRPWLERLRTEVIEVHLRGRGGGVVLACSALRRVYRDILRGGAGGDVFFVMLSGEAEVIRARIRDRRNHFMPPSLLASQLRTLEPLDLTRERGVVVDLAKTPTEIVQDVQRRLTTAARL